MSTLSKPYLTPEQYLAMERKAEFKSEYYQGEMFAMSGARRTHNLIAVNAVRELTSSFAGGPARRIPTICGSGSLPRTSTPIPT